MFRIFCVQAVIFLTCVPTFGVQPILTIGSLGELTAVAYSPDGNSIQTGSETGFAMEWDTATGEMKQVYSGHTAIVNAVAYSPDGNLIVTASADGTARLWNSETNELVHQFVGHSGAINAVAFTPNGLRVVTASDDETARVWSVSSGNRVARFANHSAPLTSCGGFSGWQDALTGSTRFDGTALGNPIGSANSYIRYPDKSTSL